MIIVDVGTSFFIRISEKAAIAMLCNCKDKQHPKVEGVVGKKRKGTEKRSGIETIDTRSNGGLCFYELY